MALLGSCTLVVLLLLVCTDCVPTGATGPCSAWACRLGCVGVGGLGVRNKGEGELWLACTTDTVALQLAGGNGLADFGCAGDWGGTQGGVAVWLLGCKSAGGV